MRYLLLGFLLSDDPSRCNCRTIRGCRLYRSSHAGCRCGRSGSSLFLGGFLLLRWSNRGLARAVHSCSDWCRYKYTCRRPGRLLAANGCRPKRSGFGLRGRSRLNHAGMTFLKLLRFSDDLCLSFCPRRHRCRTTFLSCRLF